MLTLLLYCFLSSNSVGTGLDQLIADDFHMLKGRNIAVLTNQTALSASGTPILELLTGKPEIKIRAILSPEHGFMGKLDQENVPDSVDKFSGLTVFSLYGKHRKPTPEMLRGVDLLLFDIQDIGVRFYTYQTTMLLAMQACQEQHIEFVVLDRPNPLGGVQVQGPLLDKTLFAFTGSFKMPVVHGMTMGEMAEMFRGERFPDLKLSVIHCSGWKRNMTFEQTGLLWINPSPNMRNLNQARLYPAIGMLEYTNISVGRGTDTPFERIGAPWISPIPFAEQLNGKNIPGLSFIPFYFTPESGPYANERCGGVQIYLNPAESFDPVLWSYTIFRTLKNSYSGDYKGEKYIKLLGNRKTFEALASSTPVEEIRAREKKELTGFLNLRKKYIFYPNVP